MYTEKVMQHFMNPQNVGEIENPDGVGEVGNPVCGDMMKITIRVEGGRIADVKFKTLGCNLFHGKDTPCDAKVVDENAAMQTKVGMTLSDYPEEWCYDY